MCFRTDTGSVPTGRPVVRPSLRFNCQCRGRCKGGKGGSIGALGGEGAGCVGSGAVEVINLFDDVGSAREFVDEIHGAVGFAVEVISHIRTVAIAAMLRDRFETGGAFVDHLNKIEVARAGYGYPYFHSASNV